MLRFKPQLIALVVVLVMAQVAFADGKILNQEVIVGTYVCDFDGEDIFFEGTNGIFSSFRCKGVKVEQDPCSIESANTVANLLEGQGCTVGPIEETDIGGIRISLNFVCSGGRNRVVRTVDGLCSSILLPTPTE